jgi:hypothetical protein
VEGKMKKKRRVLGKKRRGVETSRRRGEFVKRFGQRGGVEGMLVEGKWWGRVFEGSGKKRKEFSGKSGREKEG